MTTFLHPVEVKDCEDVFAQVRAKEGYTDSPFFHRPYLRGLDVAPDGTIYAAVTGCRCVVRISKARAVETVLTSEKPWTPTGVAIRGTDVFVLEYTHHDQGTDWVPRVRKLGADGKVTILANVAPEENKREP